MTRRRGIALFAALATMAVIGLLVAGMVASSTLAQRSERLSHQDAELTASADYALGAVLERARALALFDLPLGIARAVTVPGSDGRSQFSVAVTRLAGDVAWIVAFVRGAGGTSARRVNLIARWRAPGDAPPAAVIARGGVRLGAAVAFASDTSGEADCRATGREPRVIVAPSSTVAFVDSVAWTRDTSAADSSSFFLATAQRRVLDSLPGVLHVRGDTTLGGGRVDGVLVVDGNLLIDGSVTIGGLVVAAGWIDARPGRLVLDGALLSFAAPIAGQFAVELGSADIRHSPCAVRRAWRAVVPLRPVRERSWAEVF